MIGETGGLEQCEVAPLLLTGRSLRRTSLQGLSERGGVLEAAARTALDTLAEEGRGDVIHVERQVLGVAARRVHVAEQRLQRLRLFPRQRAGEHFECRHAKGKQVDAV